MYASLCVPTHVCIHRHFCQAMSMGGALWQRQGCVAHTSLSQKDRDAEPRGLLPTGTHTQRWAPAGHYPTPGRGPPLHVGEEESPELMALLPPGEQRPPRTGDWVTRVHPQPMLHRWELRSRRGSGWLKGSMGHGGEAGMLLATALRAGNPQRGPKGGGRSSKGPELAPVTAGL